MVKLFASKFGLEAPELSELIDERVVALVSTIPRVPSASASGSEVPIKPHTATQSSSASESEVTIKLHTATSDPFNYQSNVVDQKWSSSYKKLIKNAKLQKLRTKLNRELLAIAVLMNQMDQDAAEVQKLQMVFHEIDPYQRRHPDVRCDTSSQSKLATLSDMERAMEHAKQKFTISRQEVQDKISKVARDFFYKKIKYKVAPELLSYPATDRSGWIKWEERGDVWYQNTLRGPRGKLVDWADGSAEPPLITFSESPSPLGAASTSSPTPTTTPLNLFQYALYKGNTEVMELFFDFFVAFATYWAASARDDQGNQNEEATKEVVKWAHDVTGEFGPVFQKLDALRVKPKTGGTLEDLRELPGVRMVFGKPTVEKMATGERSDTLHRLFMQLGYKPNGKNPTKVLLPLETDDDSKDLMWFLKFGEALRKDYRAFNNLHSNQTPKKFENGEPIDGQWIPQHMLEFAANDFPDASKQRAKMLFGDPDAQLQPYVLPLHGFFEALGDDATSIKRTEMVMVSYHKLMDANKYIIEEGTVRTQENTPGGVAKAILNQDPIKSQLDPQRHAVVLHSAERLVQEWLPPARPGSRAEDADV